MSRQRGADGARRQGRLRAVAVRGRLAEAQDHEQSTELRRGREPPGQAQVDAGYEPALVGPNPEVGISVSLAGHDVSVSMTLDGALEAREVSGRRVPDSSRRLIDDVAAVGFD